MNTEAGHNNRPTITVVTRIVNVLHGRCNVDSAPNMGSIKRLNDVFASVVQPAIAQKKTKASISQVVLMIFRDAIRYKSKTATVLFAMPLRAVDFDALGNG